MRLYRGGIGLRVYTLPESTMEADLFQVQFFVCSALFGLAGHFGGMPNIRSRRFRLGFRA